MRRLVRRFPVLAVAVLALFSTPWWLPANVGGNTYYFYILTDSMRGTLDPGTFVALRPAPEYRVGEVVGYRLRGEEGQVAIIVHRVVGREANGDYITKGDANRTSETVSPQDIVGRMVFSLPYLGYVLMVFQAAPHLLGLLMVAALVVGGASLGGRKGPAPGAGRASSFPWFFVGLGVVALSAPFATAGLVQRFGTVPVLAFLVGMLVVLRALERHAREPLMRALVELNYVLVMAMALASVPAVQVVRQLRELFVGG